MAYTPTPPTVDPSQKGPVLSGANDVPYVGKPKPGIPPTMPPGGTNRPPQKPRYGSSDGSGFDFQAYLAGKHRPRPVQVLPGQGMGPMPVGTKPLPNPVVKDPRTGGGGLEDWMKSHPNGPIYDDWSGSWSRGRGGQSGGQPPWLVGKVLPMDIGPGSANERAQAALRAEWEAKNGPWQGGPTLSTGDNRLNRGDNGASGGGMTTGLWNPPDRNPGENPNDYYARTRAGGGMQDMKGPAGQGGEQIGVPVNVGGPKPQFQGGQSVAPGMGMPTQYGGPRDNNAGRLSRQAIAGGLMDDRGYPGAQFGGTQVQMKPGGMGAGGVDPSTGVWTPPSDEYMRGLEGGQIAPKWAGAPGSKEYEGWLNSDQRKARLESRGTVNDNYDTSGQGAINRTPGGPPPVGTGPGSMGKPQQPGGMPSREGGARHRGQRPPQAPVNPQALQQGAEALYGDNTIPHEFKGQLLQAAQSGDAQAFNEMLFNSGIPHETKLRLQQMFGYGGGAPTQAATPDQGVRQAGPLGGFDPRMGSGYYGAF